MSTSITLYPVDPRPNSIPLYPVDPRPNSVRVYYRCRTAKDNIYSFRVPRKCFNAEKTSVWISSYRLRRCESDVCLIHGDFIDFSTDDDFSSAGLLDVYRSESGRLYRACRG